MKTAKPPPPASAAAETSSSRRQPVRQTRTHGSRNAAAAGRALAQRDTAAAVLGRDQSIDIFPGITHFSDAITALPKELVRHFTLLKEVDAKMHAPEQALFQAVEKTLNSPLFDPTRTGTSSVLSDTATTSLQLSSNGAAPNGTQPPTPVPSSTAVDPNNIARRKAFRETSLKIQEILLSLDEKNHVIATATDALNKHLSRIDNIWPHLLEEFSDEAKWGSNTHWAYPENRADKSGRALTNAQAERSRREGAASLAAAAQHLAEEAAARSDARKQAVAAKKDKNNRAHAAHDSDADDHDPKPKESSRKPAANAKSRKTAATASAESPTPVGLGIANATPSNPTAKRRKVEKPANANGGTSMERAMSGVFGNNTTKPKTSSPRETPAPDGLGKKRKALPTAGNQSKKSRSGVANSPSITSSPVIGGFPDPIVKPARNSPVPIPTPAARAPVASRAKPTTQTITDTAKPRPPSSAANKPNGIVPAPQETFVQANGTRPVVEVKPVRESPVIPQVPKVELQKPEPILESTTAIPPPIIPPPPSRRSSVAKVEDHGERSKEGTPSAMAATVAANLVNSTVTTKSGRASKPSTPGLGSFPDSVRARPSRASEVITSTGKRSHKKGASAALAAALQASGTLTMGDPTGAFKKEGDDDEDEPLYCYCQQPSYGEMIACDAAGCVREWFHLDCAGLKAAPKGNVKWYCRECKKRLNISDKKTNGV